MECFTCELWSLTRYQYAVRSCRVVLAFRLQQHCILIYPLHYCLATNTIITRKYRLQHDYSFFLWLCLQDVSKSCRWILLSCVAAQRDYAVCKMFVCLSVCLSVMLIYYEEILEFQFYLFMAQNYCIIKIFLYLILHLFWKNNV